MPSSGAAFYDERDVFEVYASGVAPGPWSANHVMEEPAFLRLLGEVSGLRVLDLGCGDARIGRRLLADGCRRYTGIDSSKKMIDAATETLRGTAGWIRLGTLEDLDEDGGAYDVVISRMAFHYVENLDRLLGACARCLRPVPGWSSPSCTPSSPHTTGAPVRENGARSWEVDDYFDRGPREQAWLGGSVIWHHGTVEDHVVALQRAGFTLSGLSEAEPETVRFEGDDAEHARRRRIPLFLLLAGQRT